MSKTNGNTIVGGNWDDEEDEMEPFRTVVLVTKEKIPTIMGKMKCAYTLSVTS